MPDLNPQWIDQPGRGDCVEGITDLPDQPFGNSGIPLVPESEWKDRAAASQHMRPLVQKIKNQRSRPSCASNAATQCLEISTMLQLPQSNWIELSAAHLYIRVGLGRGRNGGSYLSDNLKELTSGPGVLPVDKPETRAFLEEKGFRSNHVYNEWDDKQPQPQDWEQTAPQFRIFPDEVYNISNFQEFVSCIFAGHPVCYGRAGHAICGVDVEYDGNTCHIVYANSWGNWGDEGYGYDSQRYIERNGGSYGAWCSRAARLDIYQQG